MKFIKVEEFLKQPVEVQKVFLDWWKEEKGDLFVLRKEYEEIKHSAEIRCCNYDLAKMYGIPLFTEGQLRQFIEDKTDSKIVEIMYFEGTGYDIGLLFKEGYEDLGEDLLQAYWKVAIRIAKEKVKE